MRPILPLCGGVVTLLRCHRPDPGLRGLCPPDGGGAGRGTGLGHCGICGGADHAGGLRRLLSEQSGDVAADWFQSFGISRLDLLVLTHFDDDHFNGVEQLFARLDVGAVAVPEITDETGRMALLEGWAEARGRGGVEGGRAERR